MAAGESITRDRSSRLSDAANRGSTARACSAKKASVTTSVRNRGSFFGGVSAQLPLLYRVRGAASARSGDPVGAVADLERSLAAAEARQAQHELALTRRVLGLVAESAESGTGTALLEQADVELAALGIVWTPEFLQV